MSSEPSEGVASLEQTVLARGHELSTKEQLFHTAIAERLGLNPTDHKALDLIAREGPMTAGQLAERTGLTTGAITGVIDHLEKAGFARRVKSPADRRQVIIEAVAERLPEIQRLFVSLTQAMTALHSRYTREELCLIVDYFTRCVRVLEAETEKLRQEEGKVPSSSG